MDRLQVVALFLLACDGGGGEAMPSRVNAVAAKPVEARDVEAFCDFRADASTAKPFALPELADGPAPPSSSPQWVNVWATWCGPCVAEMPRLAKWTERMNREGTDVQLVFLSVDKGPNEVKGFYKRHTDLPGSVRIADVEQLGPWLESVGVPPGTAIPLHFFVDREGRTRCQRAGAVNDADYAVVKQVLTGA